jgi:hypothetical protein
MTIEWVLRIVAADASRYIHHMEVGTYLLYCTVAAPWAEKGWDRNWELSPTPFVMPPVHTGHGGSFLIVLRG